MATKKIIRYKFLRNGLKSEHGKCEWKIGEWKEENNISICDRGFHCSKTPLQALGYVAGEILAEVECGGKSVIENDKECYEKMRIVKAYHWTKVDSVALAIFSAELVIDIFEKYDPNDKRPREAIEAAKKYLADPTEENRSAAVRAVRAAYAAAYAAYAAVRAADAAAYAAARAADAAYAAARAARAADAAYAAAYAAYAAADAAYAAAYAADAAVRAELISKVDKWFLKRIKVLKPYEVKETAQK